MERQCREKSPNDFIQRCCAGTQPETTNRIGLRYCRSRQRIDRGWHFFDSSWNGEIPGITILVAGDMAFSRNVGHLRSVMLWRIGGPLSAKRRDIYLPARNLGAQRSLSVWLDVPAGSRSWTHGSARHRNGELCGVYCSAVS